jgi:hypothetical protein
MVLLITALYHYAPCVPVVWTSPAVPRFACLCAVFAEPRPSTVSSMDIEAAAIARQAESPFIEE